MTNTNQETPRGQWPKVLPTLTEEQTRIRHEWMKMWHEILPNKYSFLEDKNHKLALMRRPTGDKLTKTLEVGAGLGSHIQYENLKNQEYFINDLRPNFVEAAVKKHPEVKVIIGDVQKGLDLPDHSFDRILAIHVLEHLTDLPSALREMKRLLKPDGYLSVVIPCEGGLAYQLAREISAKRLFEKKYKTSYDWFIKSEHLSTAREILHEIEKLFVIEKKSYFPFPVPLITPNLIAGLTCQPK